MWLSCLFSVVQKWGWQTKQCHIVGSTTIRSSIFIAQDTSHWSKKCTNLIHLKIQNDLFIFWEINVLAFFFINGMFGINFSVWFEFMGTIFTKDFVQCVMLEWWCKFSFGLITKSFIMLCVINRLVVI